MEMINVLMVGPDRTVHGGISAIVNEYYKAGLDKKVNLKYIGTMKEGSKLKKLFIAALAYARFFRELPWCNVVHIHFSSDASFMRKSFFIKLAYKHGKKIVLHQHGGDFVNYYTNQITDNKRQYVKEILSMGDIMLVLTKSWKEFFSQIIGEEKIVVFPNGILTEKEHDKDYEGKTNAVSTDSYVFRNYKSILFLGRICRDKGIDELLDAIKSIHGSDPEVMLYVGGIFEDESYKKRFEDCKDFVKYLGWISGEKKDRLIESCGILALPSYYEGFPVSIIEAMNKGTAVVATCVGGIPDIISDGEDGVLISPRDTDSLKNALTDLIYDQQKLKILAQNGKEKVEKCFSIGKNIEKLLVIYNSLLQ